MIFQKINDFIQSTATNNVLYPNMWLKIIHLRNVQSENISVNFGRLSFSCKLSFKQNSQRTRGDYYVLGILNVLNFFEIFEIKVLNMLPH